MNNNIEFQRCFFSDTAIRVMQLVQRAPIHQQMMFTSQMHRVQMQTQLVIYVWVTKEDPPITQCPLQPMLPVALNHTEQLQQLKKDWRFQL